VKFIDLSKPAWQWATLLLLSAIWGSSFILMKRGLVTFDYMQTGALRIVFAFLFLLPIMLKRFRKLTKENLVPLMIIGFAGNFFPAFLFTKAQTEISSSLAGMLNVLTPLFTLIFAIVLYHQKITGGKVAGVLVGLAGAAGLIWSSSGISSEGNILYGLYAVAGTACYAISINHVKYKIKDMNGLTITAFSFMFTGPVAIAYLFFSDFETAYANPEFFSSLFYIIILAFSSSAVAVVIFNILIQYTSPIFSASVTYVIPLFALAWGLWDGEGFSLLQGVFMTITVGGIYIVNKSKS